MSIVIPVYNEEENIIILHGEIISVLKSISLDSYEIIFVNDGSTDKSETALKELAQKDEKLKIINLKTNYGQTAALSAGIDLSEGDVIITLDGDLQNDPKDIPDLLEKLEKGCDVVSGWRKNRKDKRLTRIIPSKIANWLISRISGVKLHDYGCTIKAYRRAFIKDVRLYGEMHRFIPVYIAWQGGKVEELEINHRPRRFGQTKYGLNRTFKVISDLMLMKFMEKYSLNPIHLFGGFGLFNFFLSFLTFGLMIYFKILKDKSFVETPLPLLVILFIFVGILSVFMGFISEILMRTYYESQSKQIYQIQDILN